VLEIKHNQGSEIGAAVKYKGTAFLAENPAGTECEITKNRRMKL
jgi:hypothetical protein